mmetsp:Transcript_41785/g.116522  ORF Transcript_41785/g.116522 Transcript_41785/m.116522 type:complete len:226 (-) Transcript_41785:879-1556(-)
MVSASCSSPWPGATPHISGGCSAAVIPAADNSGGSAGGCGPGSSTVSSSSGLGLAGGRGGAVGCNGRASFRISLAAQAVGRCDGSFVRRISMNCCMRGPMLRLEGKRMLHSSVLLLTSAKFDPSNRGVGAKRAKKSTTPAEKTSTFSSYCPKGLRKTSGAVYPAEPQHLCIAARSVSRAAMPKSVSNGRSPAPNSMFSGFTSRWTMRTLWMCARAASNPDVSSRA